MVAQDCAFATGNLISTKYTGKNQFSPGNELALTGNSFNRSSTYLLVSSPTHAIEHPPWGIRIGYPLNALDISVYQTQTSFELDDAGAQCSMSGIFTTVPSVSVASSPNQKPCELRVHSDDTNLDVEGSRNVLSTQLRVATKSYVRMR